MRADRRGASANQLAQAGAQASTQQKSQPSNHQHSGTVLADAKHIKVNSCEVPNLVGAKGWAWTVERGCQMGASATSSVKCGMLKKVVPLRLREGRPSWTTRHIQCNVTQVHVRESWMHYCYHYYVGAVPLSSKDANNFWVS